MADVYHLNLNKAQLEGARLALLPGDPQRVSKLAALLDPAGRELAYKREYRTYLCRVDAEPVLVTSTGIGGPSAAIAIDELAQLGVQTFLRVGTTGAIQPHILVGDVVITSGAVRLDGASTHYAPLEYPAVAHHELVAALIEAAEAEGVAHHVGLTASSDTFYPGQERKDSFTGYVPRRFAGTMEEWRRLHVLNYEMEASTVLTLCSAFGLRGGCVTGVVVNRTLSERVERADLDAGEGNASRVAVEALRRLVRAGATCR